MNRRSIVGMIVGGILGAFGVKKATAQEPSTKPVEQPKTQGFILCYQSVGCLPPFKAEALCERIADQMCKKRDKDFPGWAVIVVPVRPPQETRIEIHGVNGNHVDKIEPVKIEGELAQIIVDDTPKLRAQIKDYTLLMLGAPVITPNFNDSYFESVCDMVYRRMTDTSYTANPVYHYCRTERCYREGVVAFCMLHHGRQMDMDNPEREDAVDRGIEMIREWEEKLGDEGEFQAA